MTYQSEGHKEILSRQKTIVVAIRNRPNLAKGARGEFRPAKTARAASPVMMPNFCGSATAKTWLTRVSSEGVGAAMMTTSSSVEGDVDEDAIPAEARGREPSCHGDHL